MSETGRIWDLLQRAYEGNVWHGPALRELVESVTAEQAAARPIPNARTIWELVLHITAYEEIVRLRMEGHPIAELPEELSWPDAGETSTAAWRATTEHFESAHRRLRKALSEFRDCRLNDVVPGRDYPFYLMLYGVIQHNLYHAGQIVQLMQAQGLTPTG